MNTALAVIGFLLLIWGLVKLADFVEGEVSFSEEPAAFVPDDLQ